MTVFRVKNKNRWYVKIWSGGKLDGQYHRAKRGFDHKEDAKEAEAIIKAKLKAQGPVSLAPQLFIDLWIRYMVWSEENNGRAWFNVKKAIGAKYFSKWFNRTVESISIQELQDHFIQRKALSPRSANLDFEILKHFFGWCFDSELITVNHFLKKSILKKFHVDPTEKEIPSKGEVEKLMEANTGQDRLMLLLLALTMARVGEIINLRWERDIDFEHGVVRLSTRKTATGNIKTREVPIAPRLLEALREHRQESGPVLRHHDGKPFVDLRDRLSKCYEKAGLPERSDFHRFRHYGVSKLLEIGTDPVTVMRLAGHGSLSITTKYSHASQDSLRQAIDGLDNVV